MAKRKVAPKKKPVVKKKATKTISKSAKSGEIVSKEFADENPDTTFTQRVSTGKKKESVKKDVPKKAPSKPKVQLVVGESYNFVGVTGKVVSLDPFEVVTQTLRNGCVIDGQMTADAKKAKPLSAEDKASLSGN